MTDKTYTQKELDTAKLEASIKALETAAAFLSTDDIGEARTQINGLLFVTKLSLESHKGEVSTERAHEIFKESF